MHHFFIKNDVIIAEIGVIVKMLVVLLFILTLTIALCGIHCRTTLREEDARDKQLAKHQAEMQRYQLEQIIRHNYIRQQMEMLMHEQSLPQTRSRVAKLRMMSEQTLNNLI
jgi:sensor domain CHASE-containing protein